MTLKMYWCLSSSAVRLLAVLCVTAGCVAIQQQQQQQQQQSGSSSTTAAGQQRARSYLAEVVRQELQPIVDQLESRVDARLELLESRVYELMVQVLMMNSQPQPDELSSRLDQQQEQLDELAAKLDRKTTQLDEVMSEVNSQESRLDDLDTKVNIQKSHLDTVITKVDRQTSRLETLSTQLDSQKSQMTSLTSNLTGQQSQLAVLTNTSHSERSRLDRVVNKTAIQQTGIAQLTVRLDHVELIALRPHDCSELPAGATTGVYPLWPGLNSTQPPVQAFCQMDQDGGRWTVFQRRDAIEPHQDFYLGWAAYKSGFGDLAGEFWWGLNNLWLMTSASGRQYELRIDLEAFDNSTAHAVYKGFRISSEANGYKLSASNYTGDAGDSLRWINSKKFSTRDRDQDGWSGVNCAVEWKAAWWYDSCSASSLNGLYLESGVESQTGIWWLEWRRYESLKKTRMMTRPV